MDRTTLRPPDDFRINDLVELQTTRDGPARGHVVASRDGGQWIYVMWRQRPGHNGRVTAELASDLRKVNGKV
jgi:hypothetical protein